MDRPAHVGEICPFGLVFRKKKSTVNKNGWTKPRGAVQIMNLWAKISGGWNYNMVVNHLQILQTVDDPPSKLGLFFFEGGGSNLMHRYFSNFERFPWFPLFWVHCFGLVSYFMTPLCLWVPEVWQVAGPQTEKPSQPTGVRVTPLPNDNRGFLPLKTWCKWSLSHLCPVTFQKWWPGGVCLQGFFTQDV